MRIRVVNPDERQAREASFQALKTWNLLHEYHAPHRLVQRAERLWESTHQWWQEEHRKEKDRGRHGGHGERRYAESEASESQDLPGDGTSS